IEVYSRSKNTKSGLLMTTPASGLPKKRKKSYHPDVRDSSELIPKKGTTIVLTELKMERFRRPNDTPRIS
ncbi:hypothetical protein PSA5_28455, partial [Pseudomonas syringae pv. actinidiae]